MNAYYFGCMRGAYGHTQAGHHYYLSGGKSPWRWFEGAAANGHYGIGPWPSVDGRLAPRRWEGRNADEEPQGVAALLHKDGWTALSFWDRSGDSRGASNSNFFFDAILDFDAAVAAAREHFSELWARFDFEVVLKRGA